MSTIFQGSHTDPQKLNNTSATREFKHEIWITLLALLSVGIAIYQISEPVSEPRFTTLDAVDLVIVLIFAGDMVVQALRDKRGPWSYLLRNWWLLPSLIPSCANLLVGFKGLSLARGIRLVAIVRAMRMFRVLGILPRLHGAVVFLVWVAREARLGSLFGVSALVVVFGALMALASEHSVNARLTTFPDALWWSFNMCSNVAYVDFQPQTTGGRILAAILQLYGIAFIGVFTASLTGVIIKEKKARTKSGDDSKL
jgi:voltage-gated potassium channel